MTYELAFGELLFFSLELCNQYNFFHTVKRGRNSLLTSTKSSIPILTVPWKLYNNWPCYFRSGDSWPNEGPHNPNHFMFVFSLKISDWLTFDLVVVTNTLT